MKPLKKSSQLAIGLAALSLIATYFLPIWRIDLWAPQYPEGLAMYIWLTKLSGDVEIINGLNHYIGMAHIKEEMFPEFTVLPYVIGFLVAFGVGTALSKSRRLLVAYFSMLVVFGMAALYDFWRWGYQYGHNLDPKAPIQVPGMSYQPPVIGYKQLLNFGAYSIPDTGGWIIALAGAVIAWVLVYESSFRKGSTAPRHAIRNSAKFAAFALLFTTQACTAQPEAISYGHDGCAHCKMTLADNKFSAQLATMKGRVFKFDDLDCMLGYMQENKLTPETLGFAVVGDYTNPGNWLDITKAVYLKSEELRSPMRGNAAAFTDAAAAGKVKEKLADAQVISWAEVQSALK